MLRLLRDIRNIRVVVYHPKDRERDDLVAQIHRIGCKVEALWPPQVEIPSHTDIAFLLFRQDALTTGFARSLEHRRPNVTLIGIVEFESPTMLETVVRTGASAVITKPIRAFGLLTTISVAHTLDGKVRTLSERLEKVQARLSGLKIIEKAKTILMSRKGLSEQEAYDALRARAMSRRMTIEAVCQAIVEADEMFGTSE